MNVRVDQVIQNMHYTTPEASSAHTYVLHAKKVNEQSTIRERLQITLT